MCDDCGLHGGHDEVGEAAGPGFHGLGIELVPAREHARMQVRLLVDDAAGDHRAAALERRAQLLELLRLQLELELKVLQLGRAGLAQVAQQAGRAGIVRLHPVELGARERVDQPRRLVRDEQVLSAVDGEDGITACAESAEPRVFRSRPLAEPGLVRRVRLFVTGPEEARQGAVGGACQQASIVEELLRILERPQGPVRREAAFEGPALEEVGHTRRVRGHPTAAIVTIGNEVVSGDIENTNASWLARRLEQLGVVVRLLAAVPDEVEAIARLVRREADEADLVIVTGGLGGTPDDVTREAIASAFAVPQREHVEIAGRLRARFARAPDYAARWALLPERARPLEIERGGAPGFALENVYVLPGLPGEMKPMFESLEEELRRERPIGSWRRTFSTRESEISPLLAEAERRYPDVRVGSYPTFTPDGPFVEVVIKSADPVLLAEAQNWLEGEIETLTS